MDAKNRFRTKPFKLAFSEEEKLILENLSEKSGLTKSACLRSLLVNGTINVKQVDDETKELLRQEIKELNHIGYNINQIAYNTNIKGYANSDDIQNAWIESKKIYKMSIDMIQNLSGDLEYDSEEKAMLLIDKIVNIYGMEILESYLKNLE